MNPITCVIVDDEPPALEAMELIIQRYFAGRLQIVAMTDSVKTAVTAIKDHNPQIVFLDIEMPFENGFRLFEYFSVYDFEVIFVTGYEHHAINAIKYGALDFLLKPVNYIDLLAAVARFEKKMNMRTNHLRIESMLSNLSQGLEITRKVALPTNDGYQMVSLNEIVFCEADVNYTRIHGISGKTILVAKTLKLIEEMLAGENFFRIHKSYLINMNFLKAYSKSDGYEIVLETGHRLPVALRKNEEFIGALTRKGRNGRGNGDA